VLRWPHQRHNVASVVSSLTLPHTQVLTSLCSPAPASVAAHTRSPIYMVWCPGARDPVPPRQPPSFAAYKLNGQRYVQSSPILTAPSLKHDPYQPFCTVSPHSRRDLPRCPQCRPYRLLLSLSYRSVLRSLPAQLGQVTATWCGAGRSLWAEHSEQHSDCDHPFG
jgi:hypothetical protein